MEKGTDRLTHVQWLQFLSNMRPNIPLYMHAFDVKNWFCPRHFLSTTNRAIIFEHSVF